MDTLKNSFYYALVMANPGLGESFNVDRDASNTENTGIEGILL